MNAFDSKRRGIELYHWGRAWRITVIGVALVFVAFLVLALLDVRLPAEVIIGVVAGILGLAYFHQQQHLQQARFFKDLFLVFTARYDDLNDDLLNSLASEEVFDEQKFVDYFNLCAEEWLFYKAGYIYKPVWDAWHRGMEQFGGNPSVAELWQRERQTESYYGFEFPVEVVLSEEEEATPTGTTRTGFGR